MSMKCSEAIGQFEAYKDGELDAQRALNMEEHLAACQDCARGLAEQTVFDSRLTDALQRGSKTRDLWGTVERLVTEGAHHSVPVAPDATETSVTRFDWKELCRNLYASLLPSRRVWAGMIGVWVLIISINLVSREEDSADKVFQHPTLAQVRFAYDQKKVITAELGFLSPPADRPSGEPRDSRSQLRPPSRNA